MILNNQSKPIKSNGFAFNKMFCILFLVSKGLLADNLLYPEHKGDTLIGKKSWMTQYTYASEKDTLLDIAREFDIGQNEIIMANPSVDRWLPGQDTKIQIPITRLLPDTPHEGIVLNLAEFRLYYYPQANEGELREVITHPISIGRVDWETPLGETRVVAKNKNPVWRPPQSIKDEHAAEGDILPDIVPAGPDNPLGLYAIRLGISGYLIHSTTKPYGVGMRVSHGCIRMYPEDIERLFPQIDIGTAVYIVNQPIKVGWSNNTLYIEVHPSVGEDQANYEERLSFSLYLIEQANGYQMPIVQGSALKKALKISNGIPVAIAKRKPLPYVEINENSIY